MDENIKKKLSVLIKLANALNSTRIMWALGASLLLYFKGIVSTFHDIDIMVDEEDVEKLKEILGKFCVLQKANPNKQYKTHTFLEYKYEDVDIDVMAGFIIVKDGIDYDCSLRKDQIVEYIKLGDESIPLMSVSTWRRYYQLMNRENKVQIIDDYIQTNGSR